MTKRIITQERLKELLNYNPETGIFTWAVNRSKKILAGIPAGTISDGYVRIVVDYKAYQAHRLAWLYMTGSFPSLQIDHKDNIKNNNSWNNLRQATNSQNKINSNPSSRNTSGIKGVSYSALTNKWVAQCSVNGKVKRIGGYDNIKDAQIAYESYAKKHHGEFFRPKIL